MTHTEAMTALVTGAGRGIGRAVAEQLATQGLRVALLARTRDEVESAADAINAAGGTALGLACDVSDWHALQSCVTAAREQLGPITVLVNNAGVIGPLQPTATVDPEAWARVIEINVVGAFNAIRAVLPDMAAAGWGRIVNVSSGAAQGTGIVRASAYSASKAALDMLTRSLAAELSGDDIAVVSVYPGVVDTAMQTAIRAAPPDELGAATSERFHGYHREGALLGPDEPARLIAALCGQQGARFNGQTLRISDDAAQALIAGTA